MPKLDFHLQSKKISTAVHQNLYLLQIPDRFSQIKFSYFHKSTEWFACMFCKNFFFKQIFLRFLNTYNVLPSINLEFQMKCAYPLNTKQFIKMYSLTFAFTLVFENIIIISKYKDK